MKCITCGFAASDPSATICPFCKTQGSAALAPGRMPAYAAQGAQAGAAIWPPAPTSPLPHLSTEGVGREALKQQRQVGIAMDIGAMAGVYAASAISHLLPQPYGSVVVAAAVLGCIYPHFRGSAHWAESKGYPRSTGRLAGLLGWIGPLLLAAMTDKTKPKA